jgi:hypothetical protein
LELDETEDGVMEIQSEAQPLTRRRLLHTFSIIIVMPVVYMMIVKYMQD